MASGIRNADVLRSEFSFRFSHVRFSEYLAVCFPSEEFKDNLEERKDKKCVEETYEIFRASR